MSSRLLLPAVLVAFATLSAQVAPNNQADGYAATLRSTRREVLVDVVVRDKHHHLVTNLRPEEVQIYEDGVLQKTNSFRNVEGAEELAGEKTPPTLTAATGTQDKERSASTASGATTTVHDMNFVAVVFADIAPLNLEFARTAVRDFLDSGNLPNTYVSLYRVSHDLRVVQFYTANKETISKAVDAAAKGLTSNDNDSLSVRASVVSSADSAVQAAAANLLSDPRTNLTTAAAVRNAAMSPLPTIVRDPLFARDAASQDVSVALGTAILAQARIEKGLRFANSLYNGMDALDVLREIVHSQEQLPGRKVVIYLSDGLDFPVNRHDAVDNLVSYANRSGVSFYGVDTRGLNARTGGIDGRFCGDRHE